MERGGAVPFFALKKEGLSPEVALPRTSRLDMIEWVVSHDPKSCPIPPNQGS